MREVIQYSTGYRLGPKIFTLCLSILADFLSPTVHSYSRLNCRLTHSLYELDSDGLVLCVVGQRSLAELTANTRLLVTTEGPRD